MKKIVLVPFIAAIPFVCIAQGIEEDADLVTSGTDSFFSGPHKSLNVEVSDDKKLATLKFKTWRLSNKAKTSIEIQTPFDKDSGKADPINLDGLSHANAITLGIDIIDMVDLIDDPMAAEDVEGLCRQYLLIEPERTCSAGNVHDQAKKWLENYKKDKEKYKGEGEGEELFQKVCRLTGVSLDYCNENDFPDELALQFGRQKKRIYSPLTTAWLYPIKIKYGVETFEFNDASNFEVQKDDKYPSSASFGVGYLGHRGFIGGGIEYQRSFEDADEKEICRPFEGSADITQCESFNLGKPAEKERKNIFLEMRYRSLQEKIAFGLKVTHDAENDEDAVEVPIYFIESRELGLHSGIKFNWSSDSDEVISSFFFGTSFSFFE